MIIFAIQDSGACSGANTLDGYQKYGKSTRCEGGKGGPLANDVYEISYPLKGTVHILLVQRFTGRKLCDFTKFLSICKGCTRKIVTENNLPVKIKK